MITNLPNDIFLYISENFLDKNHQRLLNTCHIYPDYETQQNNNLIKKLSYKITLFTLIKKNQIYLFREIDKKLNSYVFWMGGIKKFNKHCLLYAPHIQYGRCRYCNDYLNKHKYYKMMNIYFKLVVN